MRRRHPTTVAATCALVAIFLISWCPSPVTSTAVSAVNGFLPHHRKRNTEEPFAHDNNSNNLLAISLVSDVSAAQTASTGSKQGGNPVAALFSYVKLATVNTIQGFGKLWTNHKTCNDIRSRMKAHREGLAESPLYAEMDPKERRKVLGTIEGGISYEEYVFLQKGKEDRGKVMNLVFLCFGARQFLPYAIIFNPEMLPSPFQRPGAESMLEKRSRERSAAVVNCLLNLETQAKQAPAMSKLNIFGGKKQEAKMNALRSFNDGAAQFLDSPTFRSGDGPRLVLDQLENLIYRRVDETVKGGAAFDRREQRLCQISAPLVKGMADALGNAGFFSAVTPNFMNRGKLVAHAQKVTAADYFLVNADIDLESIPWEMLQEACADRMKGTAGCSPDELRAFIKEWLDLTVHTPDSRPNYHFNGNLARIALMGCNSLAGSRDSRSTTGVLPRLLFGGSDAEESAAFNVKAKKVVAAPPVAVEPAADAAAPRNSEPEPTKKAGKKKSWSKRLLRR